MRTPPLATPARAAIVALLTLGTAAGARAGGPVETNEGRRFATPGFGVWRAVPGAGLDTLAFEDRDSGYQGRVSVGDYPTADCPRELAALRASHTDARTGANVFADLGSPWTFTGGHEGTFVMRACVPIAVGGAIMVTIETGLINQRVVDEATNVRIMGGLIELGRSMLAAWPTYVRSRQPPPPADPALAPEALRAECKRDGRARCWSLALSVRHKDPALAIELARSACTSGSSDGCQLEASLVTQRDGPRVGAPLWQKACERFRLEPDCTTAFEAWLGLGDARRAVAVADKACRAGREPLCRTLAERYERGDGLAADVKKARAYRTLQCRLVPCPGR